jgi:hypothetical protein
LLARSSDRTKFPGIWGWVKNVGDVDGSGHAARS